MKSSPPAEIAAEILRLAAACRPGRSITPAEVAQALVAPHGMQEHWQQMLPPVRAAAVALAREGRLEILRKGKPVAPEQARGVLRLRLPQEGTAEDALPDAEEDIAAAPA